MNITVICAGKIKEKYFSAAIDEYKKRLSRFASIEIIEIPDEKIPDKASAKEEELIRQKESAAMVSKIKSGSYVISMCIEGREFSSEELAAKLENITLSASRIVFIIGGSLGLSDDIKSRSDLKLSFGKITFPHQLMRVVLLEQIYRAFKINNNETYHK